VKPVYSQAEAGQEFYKGVFELLLEEKAPFLVGGAYAFAKYADIVRDTKDLDLFCRPRDAKTILSLLERAGCKTEIKFEHWLGKAYLGDRFVDLIYGSGNGICDVNDSWFHYSTPSEIYGFPVRLVPAEEMIWQKAYIMERERFDGADVQHVIRGWGDKVDWRRLAELFGADWRVLYAHLVLNAFVYPGENKVPTALLREFAARAVCEEPGIDERLCRGTVLSRKEYIPDVERWGYRDARLLPSAPMTEEEVRVWTEAAFKPE
jgi:hypothetical protein